jgi:hypothetical protein
MLKIGLDGDAFLDWKWGLPQANFWLPGCSGLFDGFMEDHMYDRTTRFGRPYYICSIHLCPLL